MTWLNKEVPREALIPDLRNSMLAQAWLYASKAEDAEVASRTAATSLVRTNPPVQDEGSLAEPQDIGELADAGIRELVGQDFKRHELTNLVTAILRAQAYIADMSSPGSDRGMDIVAGSGPLGFEKPRMCVQVKSGQGPADGTVLRALSGSVQNSGADYGLLVSWGGFTGPTQKEAQQSNYFNIRLWDSQALLNALFAVYARLPADIRARIPIKQIWIVADPRAC